jgi:hypothetical protein
VNTREHRPGRCSLVFGKVFPDGLLEIDCNVAFVLPCLQDAAGEAKCKNTVQDGTLVGLEERVLEREQPVRCSSVSKKREQPVSDPARQRPKPVRCCCRGQEGAFWDQEGAHQ